MRNPVGVLCLIAVGLAAACVEAPTGPTVAIMPSPYKPLDVFQADDQQCRGWAQSQLGKPSSDGDSSYYLQYRYNIAYEQCMYSRGNQVPGFAAPANATPPSSPPTAVPHTPAT